MSEQLAQVGVIGMAVMGSNLARNPQGIPGGPL